MTKEIWLNLPVKDVQKSKEFFGKLGFSFDQKYENADMACMIVGGKKLNVVLCSEKAFQGFARNEIADTNKASEILISFDAESREEVDELARKVEAAGGEIFCQPDEVQGWMYGFGFADLDGHRWNALFMDFSRLPQQ